MIARESSRQFASLYAPGPLTPREAQIIAYRIMPDEFLFTVEEVEVQIPPEDPQVGNGGGSSAADAARGSIMAGGCTWKAAPFAAPVPTGPTT